jgi:hypothetical protein
MSEASIRTQWKEGQSGNPKGRPKKPKCLEDHGKMLTHIVRTLLEQPCYVFGSDKPITRLERFAIDLVGRAELGEQASLFKALGIYAGGDRQRIQALRAAVRTKNPKVRRFEKCVADMIGQTVPPLGPEQQHWILPAREVRTEHLKPKPRPKYNPEPELYNEKGERNPWYFDKTDPLGHLPKHLPKEEVRAKTQAGIDALLRRHREEKEAEEKARAAAAREAEVAAAPAPEIAAKTAPTTGAETGVVTGPISGLRNALLSQQPIGSVSESPIRVNDVEDFVAQLKPNGINGGHVNGHNGSHR